MTGTPRESRPRGAAIALLALLATACFSERADPTLPGHCSSYVQNATVQIRDFDFSPATVCLARGGTVTWVNTGAEVHTSTSTSEPRVWDSGFLSNGQQYSRTFDTAGSFPYMCLPHPFMTAVIIVQ